jgi:DNA-binding transcriptional regulator GbsR (MarR family)
VSKTEKTAEVGSPARTLDSKARTDMVEAAGGLFQLLGLPRSAGQIYGLLYFSDKPLSLDDMVNLLSISKGSASMGTRHLSSWGVIRQVWVPGDRRDHFEAVEDLGQLLRASYAEFVKPRLSSAEQRMARLFEELERDVEKGALSKAEYKFCSDRMRVLLRFQEKVQSVGPLAEKLLFNH